MGRFTLRDEGKTICVGKVLKYKPYNMAAADIQKATEQKKESSSSGPVTIDNSNAKTEKFDMETGESKPAAEQLAGIAEGNEEEDD